MRILGGVTGGVAAALFFVNIWFWHANRAGTRFAFHLMLGYLAVLVALGVVAKIVQVLVDQFSQRPPGI